MAILGIVPPEQRERSRRAVEALFDALSRSRNPEILERLTILIARAPDDEHLTLLTQLEHPRLLRAIESVIEAFSPEGLE